MDLSFKKYFDLGIVISASFPELGSGGGPIFKKLDYVLDTHLFRVLEITYRNTQQGFIDLQQYLSRKGIRTVYLAPSAIQEGGLDPNSLDETERHKAVEVLKGFVDKAYFLRAEKLMICSGPDPGPAEREKAKRQLIKSLNELLEWIHQVKTDYLLELILENFDRELQKKRLLGPTHESVELIMEVKKNSGNINLILDQSHLRQLGEDHQESLSLARNCLGHVHLANCLLRDRSHPQWGDSHLAFNTEGSELGTSDIVQMLHTLFQIGYLKEGGGDKLPTISLEVKPSPPNSDPYATFKDTCNTFLEAWGRFKSRVSFED
jgi:sugar phosphate isomerase/epimerase